MTRSVASRATRLCARGLHEDRPENEYWPPNGGSRRCRPCRAAYMVDRRRASGRITAHGRVRPGALGEHELTRLRAAVACMGCGAAPEDVRGSVVTRHRAGCATADLALLDGRWPTASRA